jgi:hypothetical protein
MSHDLQAAYTAFTGILRVASWLLTGGVLHEIPEHSSRRES